MNSQISRLLPWLEKRAMLMLVLSIILFSAFWVAVAFWKYELFLYNALDLAIYSQVFWNTSYGRWFQMSIHPQSYLGDHFEPLILLLAPIYALWRDPRMLLILQTIFIHLAAIPLYLLARNIFQKTESIKYPRALALLILGAFIFNPFLHNALIFEFHILPFFLLPFFFALYFAERGELGKFLVVLFLTITVREDIPIVASLTGLVVVLLFPATTQRRRWIWISFPLITSLLWFVLSMNIISYFSPTGEFKFAIYYSSLQGGWQDTLQNIILHPWPLISRLFNGINLQTIAGLMIPFSFLPLISPMALLLALLPLLQFTTFAADSREVLVLHYGALFLPALFLAVIFALNKLASTKPLKISNFLGWPASFPLHLGILFLMSASIYGAIALGPFNKENGLLGEYLNNASTNKINSVKSIYSLTKDLNTIIATNRFLPKLSNRQSLYAIKYILDGQQQLSNVPYTISEPIDTLILDQEALLRVSVIWKDGRLQFVPYNKRAEHLRTIIKDKGLQPVWNKDGIAIFRNNSDSTKPIPLITHNEGIEKDGIDVGQGIKVRVAAFQIDSESVGLEMRWSINQQLTENYFLDLQIKDTGEQMLQNYILDPGWGLEPTSLWSPNATAISHFVLSAPKGADRISFSLFPVNDMIEEYGGLRSNLLRSPMITDNPITIKIY